MVKRLERLLTDVPVTAFAGVATGNGGGVDGELTGELRPSGVPPPDALFSDFMLPEPGFLAPCAFGLYGFLLVTPPPPEALPPAFAPAFMHCWRIIPACSMTW